MEQHSLTDDTNQSRGILEGQLRECYGRVVYSHKTHEKLTATIWCGKIYKALMHQAAVNRHRALSIQTLKAFSAAADDVHIKDAIVLEATRAVFGNVCTGYIDTPAQNSDGDIKILEIVKSVLPKK